MQKIKNYLCSEKGMRFINVLFALSLLIRRSGIGLIAYLCSPSDYRRAHLSEPPGAAPQALRVEGGDQHGIEIE